MLKGNYLRVTLKTSLIAFDCLLKLKLNFPILATFKMKFITVSGGRVAAGRGGAAAAAGGHAAGDGGCGDARRAARRPAHGGPRRGAARLAA